MGWVRISDDFYDNEKIVAAGPHALAIWVAAMAWCNRNLTDGLIPKAKARTLIDFTGHAILLNTFGGEDGDACGDYAIGSLIGYGLVHESGHKCPNCVQPRPNGLVIHDYLKYQFSKEQIEKKAEATRRRVDAWREANQRRSNEAEARNAVSNAVTNAVTNAVVTLDVTGEPNPNPNPKSLETLGGRVTSGNAHASNPRPECRKHPNENPDDIKCRTCQKRREWDEANAAAAEADELERKRTTKLAKTKALLDCTKCDDNGWLLGPDGTTAEPAMKCGHATTGTGT